MATKLPNGDSITLKYLFKAELQNGKTYQQNADDLSVNDPGRSCFFDIKDADIKRFTLEGDGNTVVVDLTDGHFEINGAHVVMHEKEMENFRVLYFRIRDIHFDIGMNFRGQHDVTYMVGWQANEKKTGKNYKKYILIK